MTHPQIFMNYGTGYPPKKKSKTYSNPYNASGTWRPIQFPYIFFRFFNTKNVLYSLYLSTNRSVWTHESRLWCQVRSISSWPSSVLTWWRMVTDRYRLGWAPGTQAVFINGSFIYGGFPIKWPKIKWGFTGSYNLKSLKLIISPWK